METVKKILSGISFSLFLIFHPFKGFWDLKHEKRGNLPSAIVILSGLVLVFIMRRQFTGFIFNYNSPEDFNVFFQITGIVLPFLLWCVSNWCITTLVDGEGFLKDIFITMSYATVPLIIINVPMVILSRFMTEQEAAFYNILDAVAIIWAVLLVICGLMTVHQFSLGKTIFTIIVALVCMVIILFILVLFVTLIQNIINFLRLILNEAELRMTY